MDTAAKILEIFEKTAKKIIALQASINPETNSYDFEKSFKGEMETLEHSAYQAIAGCEAVNKNERMKLSTSFGEISLQKGHPLAVAPGGFKISAYLQEQMCRLGTKMTFEESEEELNELLGIETNAKQIERLCHHYGEALNQINWREAYSDGIQLCIPFNRRQYVLMDGSMLLTRDKEQSWKEVKLCRMFYDSDRVESVSKNRNIITDSCYVAHLGGHDVFLDKVLDVIAQGSPSVFIADGAKWIWNWVEDYYPKSIQILDFYHCKEHLYSFAKEYFTEEEAPIWVEDGIEKLKTEQVDIFLKELEGLPEKNKNLLKSKNRLLNYLTNNKERINYGKFLRDGLLIGSGPIESANREVIQKRMKLSGQRWTVQGAEQMLNLRTCYKSGKLSVVRNLISDYKMIA
jgi:predicted CoA-binding protein